MSREGPTEDHLLEQVLCGDRGEADSAWQAALRSSPELGDRLRRLRELSRKLTEVGNSELTELEQTLGSRHPTLRELVVAKSRELATVRDLEPAAAGDVSDSPSLATSDPAPMAGPGLRRWLPKWVAAAAIVLLALVAWRPWEEHKPDPIFMQPGDLDARFSVTDRAGEGVVMTWQLELPVGGRFELRFYASQEALDPFLRVSVGTASSWTPSLEQRALFPDATRCEIHVLDVGRTSVDSEAAELRLRR